MNTLSELQLAAKCLRSVENANRRAKKSLTTVSILWDVWDVQFEKLANER